MPLHIYNSLTKKKEEFVPIEPSKVNMYTCGVTVYDDCHIGHARSLYIFDVIRSYLEYKKFKVNFVRNITDIDDKIINRANELKVNWRDLVEKYITSYKEDLKSLVIRLGILDKDKEEPRATKSIEDIKEYIKVLIDKDYAYVTNTGVYFSVRKFKKYGKLSGQSVDQMLTGVRKEADETKDDPLDFALWKKSKEDEPKWDSPWGEGRPGWHIECSVMSQKFLKANTLDIHAGGRDLIFPHHENEIAQSEAKTGKPFAKYWIHHGLLTINNQKMAKSLGNFITIKDFIAQYNDVDILKLFFLSAHHSQSIDFTEDKMKACKKQKKSFDDFFEKVDLLTEGKSAPKFSKENKEKIDVIYDKFEQAMDNDFNMPQALSYLFELKDLTFGYTGKAYSYARLKLGALFNIFGLKVKPQIQLPERVIKEQSEREKLKKEGDYKGADGIRTGWIKDFGFYPSDTNFGVTITRIEE